MPEVRQFSTMMTSVFADFFVTEVKGSFFYTFSLILMRATRCSPIHFGRVRTLT